MIINPKVYSSISSNIISMRKNTLAIRRTLIQKNKNKELLKKKTEREDTQLKQFKQRGSREETFEAQKFEREQKKFSLGNFKLNIRNPMKGFSVPGLGILGGVISFLGFGLLGWMLSALPNIIKSIQEFMRRARGFLDLLTEFWNIIAGFFKVAFDAFEVLFNKLGFGGAEGLQKNDDIKAKERLRTLAGDLRKFIADFPNKIKELVNAVAAGKGGDPNSPLSSGGPMGSAYGIDIARLAAATGFAEGNYNSVGTYVDLGGRERGYGLGRYQFMTYRSDVRREVKARGKAKGLTDAYIQQLFDATERGGAAGRKAADEMRAILGQEGQDALFKDHVVNTLTQIRRKYPTQTSAEFMVKKFGVYHLSGGDYPTSADIHGTTGIAHGEKIYGAYSRLPPSQGVTLTPSTRDPLEAESLGPTRQSLDLNAEIPVPRELITQISKYEPSQEYFDRALNTNISIDGDNVIPGIFE